MKLSPNTLAILSQAHIIGTSKHPEELSLRAQRRLAASIAAITQPFSREKAEQLEAQGRADRAKADDILARHSGFENFQQLLDAKGSYRPTLEVSNPERLWLADYYDKHMESAGDERRAYRYDHPETSDIVEVLSVKKNLRTYYNYEDGTISQRKRVGESPISVIRASSTVEAKRIHFETV